MTKRPARKILLGCDATVLAGAFGPWQGGRSLIARARPRGRSFLAAAGCASLNEMCPDALPSRDVSECLPFFVAPSNV